MQDDQILNLEELVRKIERPKYHLLQMLEVKTKYKKVSRKLIKKSLRTNQMKPTLMPDLNNKQNHINEEAEMSLEAFKGQSQKTQSSKKCSNIVNQGPEGDIKGQDNMENKVFQ